MASIKLRRGSGVPSGLTFGEPAFDITNSRLYVGITGGSALIAVAGGGVHSFNGFTGAVTGVTTGSANTFGPLQSFTNGISSAGGTFDSITRFSAGLCASGGTFSGTLNIPSGSTLSVLGRIVGNVVNTIHGFTGGVTFAGVNGITVDTSGAIGSAGRVNIGIQTESTTNSTNAFSLLMKGGSTAGNVSRLSNTNDLVYYHPQTSFSIPVTLVGSTGINIRGGGGPGLAALGAYNQISLGSSSVSGVNIYSSNSFLSIINSDGIGYFGGVTTGIILYTGNLIDTEYSAKIYPKAFSNSRTFELPDASGTFALTEATQTFTAPQSFTSGISASGGATFASNVAVNGGSLTTTATTGNLFNTTATTLNIGGAATTTNIAAVASGLTLNIADTAIFGGTKQINIGTNIGGGASETITIGANSGRIISRSATGICFGSSTTTNFEFLGSGNFNATSQIINASAVNAVNGVCAAGISAGSYILTSAGIKTLTGTTYTFLASDNGDVLTHDNASGCTFTIPTGLPVGYSTTVIRLNASGRVGFVAAAGVTMNTYGGFTAIAGQHASASLISYASNIYNLSGNLL